MLTPEEQRELLRIARQAIADALPRGDAPRANGGEDVRKNGQTARQPGDSRLGKPGGAFVTIRIKGELRGCIGYIESALPLAEVVKEVAVKAAYEDPRFPSLTAAEFGRIALEVSVLSPLHRISEVGEIQVGSNGLLLELAGSRGLLLPQVATEYHWTREELLENTSRKAGLPRNAWQDPEARMFIFTADIVHEEEHE